MYSYTDHPRLRGDYVAVWNSIVTKPGSPPLTRGLLSIDNPYPLIVRITPAYAGTTDVAPPPPMTNTDHPRLRGDYTKLG